MKEENLKELSIDEAIVMLDGKRGAGKALKTKIKLDIEVEFESGKPGAQMVLERIQMLMKGAFIRDSEFTGYSTKNVNLVDNSYVLTEHQDNPNWD